MELLSQRVLLSYGDSFVEYLSAHDWEFDTIVLVSNSNSYVPHY